MGQNVLPGAPETIIYRALVIAPENGVVRLVLFLSFFPLEIVSPLGR